MLANENVPIRSVLCRTVSLVITKLLVLFAVTLFVLPVSATIQPDIYNARSTLTVSGSPAIGTFTLRWSIPTQVHNAHQLVAHPSVWQHSVTPFVQIKNSSGGWTTIASGGTTQYVRRDLRAGVYEYRRRIDYRLHSPSSTGYPYSGGGGSNPPTPQPIVFTVFEASKKVRVYPPSVPQNLRVPNPVSGEFEVRWDPSTGNVKYYELEEQKIGTNGYGFTRVYSGANTFARRSHTSNGLNYRVRACRSGSCSAWSTTASTRALERAEEVEFAGTGKPGKPHTDQSYTMIYNSNGDYDLVFGAPPNRGSGLAEVDRYIIQEVYNYQPQGAPIIKPAGGTLESESVHRIPFRGKAPGNYNYRITPCNTVLNLCGDSFMPASRVVVLDIPPPVTGVTASPINSDGSIRVEWDMSTGMMVSDYKFIEIETGPSGGVIERGPFMLSQLPGGSSNLNSLGVLISREPNKYQFKVSACSFVGCGEYGVLSNQVTVHPPGSPKWMRSLNGESFNINSEQQFGSANGSYTIQWDAVPEIQDVSIWYELTETNDLTGEETTLTVTKVKNVDIETLPAVFRKDSDGRVVEAQYSNKREGVYSYSVMACMGDGMGENKCGDTTYALPVHVIYRPDTVQNLQGEVGGDEVSVNLSWDPVEHANLYEVDQKIGNGEWVQLENSDASTSRQINHIVSKITAYRYRVRACNVSPLQSDVKLCSSEKSDVIQVTLKPKYLIDTPANPAAASIPNFSSNEDRVGSTEASFKVGESGEAMYEVEIATTTGTAGVVPSLNLIYSSQRGNGLAGHGWSLGGLSSIERCRKTLVRDREMAPISWDAEDRFCLDGQRLLVQNGAVYGSPGSIYKTEVDSFAVITAHNGSTGSPSYFTMERKDGSVSTFGRTTNSRQGFSSGVLKWGLNEVKDSVGNAITFSYVNDLDGFRIKSVSYAYGGTSTAQASVQYLYENRPDVIRTYISGEQVVIGKRLTSVRSNSDGNMLRAYNVTYESTTELNQLSRIKSLQECTSGNICLPETQFSWRLPPAGSTPRDPTFLTGLSLGVDRENDYLLDTQFVDINGDGLQDIVYVSSNIKVKKRFLSKPRTQSFQRLSYMINNGTGGNIRGSGYDFGESWRYDDGFEMPLLVKPFDYNLDGRRDLLVKSETDGWHLYLSELGSAGWVLNRKTDISFPFSGDDVEFADMTGDGLPDAFDGLKYWAFERDQSKPNSSNTAYRFRASPSSVSYETGFGFNDTNLPDGIAIDDRYYNPGVTSVKSSAGDINGDGLGDFLVQRDGYQIAFSGIDGDNLILEKANNAPPVSDHTLIRFTDINADGLTDIVYWSKQYGHWVANLSRGRGFGDDLLLADVVASNADNAEDLNVNLVDINNDGFADVVWETATELRVRYWLRSQESFSSSERLRGIPAENEYVSLSHIFQDFSGDGVTDYVQFYSLPNSASAIFSFYPADGDIKINASRNLGNVITSITNGYDAKTIINYERLNQSGAYSALDEGDYEGLNNPFSLPSNTQTLQSTPHTPVLEYLGNLPIVTRVSSSSPTVDSLASTSSIRYQYGQVKLQAGGRGNLGFKALITTDEQTSIRTKTTYRQDWPFVGYPLSTEVRTPNGRLLRQSSSTWRLQGWQNSWPNQARTKGTASLGAIQPILAVSIDESFALKEGGVVQGARLSRVVALSEYDKFGNLTSGTITTDGLNADGGFGRVQEQTTVNEFGSSSYDKRMGRVSQSTVTTARPGTIDQARTSTFTYYQSGVMRGLLKTETVQPQGGDRQKLTTTHSYDSFGNKTQANTSGWDGIQMVTRLGQQTEFDDQGRYPIATYQTFPEIGEVKLSEVVSRDKYGKPTHVKDINGNSAYTAYTAMGREYFTTSDAGGWARITLASGDPLCPIGTASVVSSQSADGSRSKQCFDILGRNIRKLGIIMSEASGFNWVASDTRYDYLGRVARVSVPFTIQSSSGGGSPTSYYTTTQYDLVGNAIRITTPGGDVPFIDEYTSNSNYDVVTTITYSDYTTVTANFEGQEKTEIRNAFDEVVRVIDHDGAAVDYSYDAMGNLISVEDVAGNVSTMTYDDLGRKIAMSDPDKGDWQYEYNAFGELVLQIDAKHQSVQTIYDVLGRELQRIDIDGLDCIVNIAEWQYDSVAYGIGLVAKERNSDGYEQTPTYDRFGRSIANLMSVPSAGLFETKQTFDHLGRVFQTFDASSMSHIPGVGGDQQNGARGVQTVYDEYGFVKQTQDARRYLDGRTFGYYQRNLNMDERGNLVKYTLGNGVQVLKQYYSATGLLYSVDSQRPSPINTPIQKLFYYWDDLGNLSGRTTKGENGKDVVERFTYDSLNRLKTNTLGFLGDAKTVEVDYDLIGNMIYKSDVGHYTYGENGAGPHAATRAGDATYHYDNNGNNYFGNGRVLKYSIFDKVEEVSKGAYTTTFRYGPNRSRYQRVDIDAGSADRVASTKTTYYLGNVEYIIYNAGERAGEREYKRHIGVAVETISYAADGKFLTDDKHYLLHDHLGSVERIVSDILGEIGTPEGDVQLIQKLSYDPWGQRRDVDTQDTLTARALAKFDSSITTRGFTGHEMVDGVGIIHMNGRIYDATLARFLQADPIVQDPLDTQSLNRYSYLRNNPLNATDPTGYAAETLAAIGAFIKTAIATYVVTDFLLTVGFEEAAQVVGVLACATSGNGAACLAGSAAGSAYAFTYDFGEAAKAAGIAYTGVQLGQITSIIGEAGSLLNSIANGIAGGVLEELGGGNFGDGFLSAGVSALAKGHIKDIGYGAKSHTAHRVFARALLGGTVSELTGGKFANGAVTAAFSQLVNGESGGRGQASGDSSIAHSVAVGDSTFDYTTVGPEGYAEQVHELLVDTASTDAGAVLLTEIAGNGGSVQFSYGEGDAIARGRLFSRHTIITFNPENRQLIDTTAGSLLAQPQFVAAHELHHAWMNTLNCLFSCNRSLVLPGSVPIGVASREVHAIRYTNLIRTQAGAGYQRTHLNGIVIP